MSEEDDNLMKPFVPGRGPPRAAQHSPAGGLADPANVRSPVGRVDEHDDRHAVQAGGLADPANVPTPTAEQLYPDATPYEPVDWDKYRKEHGWTMHQKNRIPGKHVFCKDCAAYEPPPSAEFKHGQCRNRSDVWPHRHPMAWCLEFTDRDG